jgi:DNA polymerase-3 subunit alpha
MKSSSDNFCNIHNHSEYSALDGKSKCRDMVEKACELGQSSLGIMDHGNCHGHVEFYNECTKAGIKPLLGCEFYMVEHLIDPETGKKTRKAPHITVLAMNNVGLTNMYKLTALAAKQFHYFPRIELNQLCDHNEGLIVTSGCFASIISKALLEDEDAKALSIIKRLREVFGDRFYLEVQDSGVPGQPKITEKLRKIGKQLGIPRIVSNDSHYVNKEDAFPHSVMLAIQTGCRMSQKPIYEGGKRFAFSQDEYYMKSGKELSAEGWTKDEIDNTSAIADRCNVTMVGGLKLPKYPFLPEDTTSIEYLKHLCREGWRRKNVGWKTHGDYNERAKKELADIEKYNLADYFLIVQHYVNWSRDNGIVVGPGRGSAAGSLISYLLGITTVDPLQYGLYWERFWNAGRGGGTMPDIDTDFSRSGRGKIIKYMKKTFGQDRVLPVVTFGRLGARAVLKDVGRALSVPINTMNELTKAVPPTPKITLGEALSESVQLRKWQTQYPKLFAVSERLEGCVRHTGIHASAVVILDKPYQEGPIPTQWVGAGQKKQVVTAFDGDTMNDIGYLKCDILGLGTLDVLDKCRDIVRSRHANV